MLAALATCVAPGAQAQSARDSICRAVRGTLVPDCNAEICNQGAVTGDLQGRFTSKLTSIYPAGSGWIYTAWMRIELDGNRGRIETVDAATTPFDEDKGPDLSRSTEVLTIEQATGAYQDHVGTLVLVGAHALGRVTPYVGRLCHPGQGAPS